MIGPTPNRSVSDVSDAYGGLDPAVGLLELLVEDTDVAEQFVGHLEAAVLGRARRADLVEDHSGLGRIELLADPALSELHHEVVEPAHDPGLLVADVDVPLGQQPQHLGVISRHDGTEFGCAQRAIATESASFGSFLSERRLPSTRIRAARVDGTSSTVSPAASNCWDSR